MSLLLERARTTPNAVALIQGERTITYGQLAGWSAAIADDLRRQGVREGSRVAARLQRTPESVAFVHAVVGMGAVLVPIHLRLTDSETRELLARVGVDALTPISSPPPLPLWERGEEGREGGDEGEVLIFTSGTTGVPKAARLSAGNFFWSAVASAFRLGVQPGDRWLLTLPLYHVGGLSILFRSALYGTAVVLSEEDGSFDPQRLWETLHRQRVTLVSLVPTQLHRLLDAVDDLPPAHLRLILLGGAAAPPDLLQRALERGFPVATTYGLTEATSQVATALPDQVRRKPGTVGRPLLYTQVRVVDEDGRDCPAGTIGEVLVRGRTVFQGYDGDPGATARALRDGWLHTGDLGYLDVDGDLWVVNRRSDLIVTGGENVYPAEVERVLRAHPAVAEAAVVGVPDAEWGQRVAAAVVLRAEVSITDLETHCRRHLAGYKTPRLWRFVEDLPRTASGKIQRPALTALFTQPTRATNEPVN